MMNMQMMRRTRKSASANLRERHAQYPDEAAKVTTHGAGTSRATDERFLIASLATIVIFMTIEVVVAIIAHSIALLADAGHMLVDAGAIGVSIGASRLARRPPKAQWTFGWKRAEILAAAINGITLVVIAFVIVAEAIQRVIHAPRVSGLPIAIVAAGGVVVNTTITLLLARANRDNLNIVGVFAHILTDLWAFLGTFAAGMIIIFTGFVRADAIASLFIAALMLKAAWSLLRDSGRILLEAAPLKIDLADVRTHLLSEDFVRDVHDLHAWTVTSDLPALSAHIVLDEACFYDGRTPQVLDTLQKCLADHFDLIHSTFQFESPSHALHERIGHEESA